VGSHDPTDGVWLVELTVGFVGRVVSTGYAHECAVTELPALSIVRTWKYHVPSGSAPLVVPVPAPSIAPSGTVDGLAENSHEYPAIPLCASDAPGHDTAIVLPVDQAPQVWLLEVIVGFTGLIPS